MPHTQHVKLPPNGGQSDRSSQQTGVEMRAQERAHGLTEANVRGHDQSQQLSARGHGGHHGGHGVHGGHGAGQVRQQNPMRVDVEGGGRGQDIPPYRGLHPPPYPNYHRSGG